MSSKRWMEEGASRWALKDPATGYFFGIVEQWESCCPWWAFDDCDIHNCEPTVEDAKLRCEELVRGAVDRALGVDK